MKELVGQFLRHERLDVGFSLQEVSKFLGISKEEIASIERGEELSKKIYKSLCEFYGLNIFSINQNVERFRSENYLIREDTPSNCLEILLRLNDIREDLIEEEILMPSKEDKIKNLMNKRSKYVKMF